MVQSRTTGAGFALSESGTFDAGKCPWGCDNLRVQIDLIPGEQVIRVGAASLVAGHHSVAGRLYVTNARLHFAPHLPGQELAAGDILLSDIASVAPAKSPVLGVPLIRDLMIVTVAAGESATFRVGKHDEWLELIGALRRAL